MQKSKALPDIPSIKNSSEIFQESLIHLKRDILQIQDHPPYPYYVLETNPFAVVILAVTKENQFLLTHEYRHPAKKFILSCPAGYIEQEENPLAAAERELLEETGYKASFFEIIGSAYPYAGISSQKNIFIKAYEASYLQPPQLEKSEIIQAICLSEMEIYNKIQNGIELDANLLAALTLDRIKRH